MLHQNTGEQNIDLNTIVPNYSDTATNRSPICNEINDFYTKTVRNSDNIVKFFANKTRDQISSDIRSGVFFNLNNPILKKVMYGVSDNIVLGYSNSYEFSLTVAEAATEYAQYLSILKDIVYIWRDIIRDVKRNSLATSNEMAAIFNPDKNLSKDYGDNRTLQIIADHTFITNESQVNSMALCIIYSHVYQLMPGDYWGVLGNMFYNNTYAWHGQYVDATMYSLWCANLSRRRVTFDIYEYLTSIIKPNTAKKDVYESLKEVGKYIGMVE